MKKLMNIQQTGDPKLDQILLDMVNFINSLAETVNNFSNRRTEVGTVGDLRVVNDIDDSPKIQVKGKKGWYEITNLTEVKK